MMKEKSKRRAASSRSSELSSPTSRVQGLRPGMKTRIPYDFAYLRRPSHQILKGVVHVLPRSPLKKKNCAPTIMSRFSGGGGGGRAFKLPGFRVDDQAGKQGFLMTSLI